MACGTAPVVGVTDSHGALLDAVRLKLPKPPPLITSPFEPKPVEILWQKSSICRDVTTTDGGSATTVNCTLTTRTGIAAPEERRRLPLRCRSRIGADAATEICGVVEVTPAGCETLSHEALLEAVQLQLRQFPVSCTFCGAAVLP